MQNTNHTLDFSFVVKRNSEHGFELVLDKKSTNLVEPDTLGLHSPKTVQTKAWLRDCLPRLVRAMEQAKQHSNVRLTA